MGAGRDCKLLFIADSLSGRQLLVDSGAQRSILPAQAMDTMANGHGPRMDAANGTPIRTYGTRRVEVCFGERRFSWDFVMATVSTPILGADFLCAFNLLVDVKNCRLIDALSFASYPCTLGGGRGALPVKHAGHWGPISVVARPVPGAHHPHLLRCSGQAWRGAPYYHRGLPSPRQSPAP